MVETPEGGGEPLHAAARLLVDVGDGYQIWRAHTVLDMRDVEHSCALVNEAVPDIVAAHSVRNQHRLAAIHRRLTQHSNVQAVTALHERIRHLIA
jgi:hypothetical protein